jgi:hypothetical protein
MDLEIAVAQQDALGAILASRIFRNEIAQTQDTSGHKE